MDWWPSPIMHKAEKKFEIGQISDEQQQFRAILNKLTPQNFDRLFKQVIEKVCLGSPDSLAGFVSQIFDRAVLEPTYCEMYACLCSRLAYALPDFNVDNKKITFKSLLLKKCQEELEIRVRGGREEANACETREERAEKRLKARRRTLGNIQLIGELYKRRMLSERIMHVCIVELLGPSQNKNPEEEDIEALCELMSTIGAMIDHPDAKKYMDAYFDTMEKLSMKQRYPYRIRFMLEDIIDLRKNNWQQQGGGSGSESEIKETGEEERQEMRLKAITLRLIEIQLMPYELSMMDHPKAKEHMKLFYNVMDNLSKKRDFKWLADHFLFNFIEFLLKAILVTIIVIVIIFSYYLIRSSFNLFGKKGLVVVILSLWWLIRALRKLA